MLLVLPGHVGNVSLASSNPDWSVFETIHGWPFEFAWVRNDGLPGEFGQPPWINWDGFGGTLLRFSIIAFCGNVLLFLIIAFLASYLSRCFGSTTKSILLLTTVAAVVLAFEIDVINKHDSANVTITRLQNQIAFGKFELQNTNDAFLRRLLGFRGRNGFERPKSAYLMNASFLQDFSDAELRGIRGVSELRFDSDVQWSEQQIHRLSKIWDVNEVFIERNQNVKAFENHFADTPISFFEY